LKLYHQGTTTLASTTPIATSASTTPQATTSTTSTTPVTTTTTTSCATGIVTTFTGDPVGTDDGGSTFVDLPVKLEEGCDCNVANVAIAIGIDHQNVGDLFMLLFPFVSASDQVVLVNQPTSTANLVSSNKITFDDTPDANTKDPQTLGVGLGTDEDILAGTYYVQGTNTATIGADYPDLVNGLGKFNSLTAAGNWRLSVFDLVQNGDTGTIQSVELTITCAE